MLEQRLDELGWLQFEDLVQALLKAELGTGVEAWGGRGDFGRDCYCPSPLKFPSTELSEGPFVFQSKFVSGANAAGAAFFGSLRAAIVAEAARIDARMESGIWVEPKHYVLVTNCPLRGSQRRELQDLLSERLPGPITHVLTGQDLGGIASKHPSVRKAFPQLLGLGDLENLIAAALDRDLLERSKIVLESALRLGSLFVPTKTYHRAWRTLIEHSFAVLEGPPEMGKTAIATMVGAIKHFDGWELYECRTPDDFFRVFDEHRPQFFIADDAFGRTEYDPSLGKQWERELDKLLRRVDSKHWLVWTSRKHILERALRCLDIQGAAREFPNPSAVLVDASDLSVAEKTLILYRHAKDARLDEQAKCIVRTNGRTIVKHRHFTPERIRRFVSQALPRIALENVRADTQRSVHEAVTRELANPTESMRKSFAALPQSHKLFLFALVEGIDERSVHASYARLSSGESHRLNVNEVIDELSHSFIRVHRFEREASTITYFEWMHPSLRDLVIDELSAAQSERQRFLRDASANVVALALSEEGGSEGERTRPLLQQESDWTELVNTCLRLVRYGSSHDLSTLVSVLSAVASSSLAQDKCRFDELIRQTCIGIVERWRCDSEVRSTEAFEAVASLSTRVVPLPILPDPTPLWTQVVEAANDAVSYTYEIEPLVQLNDLLRLVSSLHSFEPRFLIHVGFPADYQTLLDELEEKLRRNVPSPSDDDLDTAADIAEATLDVLRSGKDVPAIARIYQELHEKYEMAVEGISEAKALRHDDDDRYDDRERPDDYFPDSMIDQVLADI